MNDQQNNKSTQPSNNNRRNNNRRRHYNKNNPNNQSADGQRPAPKQHAPRPEGQQQAQGNPNNNKKKFHNRPRPQGQSSGNQGPSIERTYEKYLNLLDQHLIARRKYHDLYFRADPNQKAKLEKNFYHSINEVREFENRLTPELKTLFEQRNNGYQLDVTYTTNHNIPAIPEPVSEDIVIEDPHLLQSQINCDFSDDKEESMGSIEDYLKYKGL